MDSKDISVVKTSPQSSTFSPSSRGGNMRHIHDSKPNTSVPRLPRAADSVPQGGIRMTLENAHLWKSFHSKGTEMIITKHGRRMFPHCSVSVTGLQPFAKYIVMMDMIPADRFKYKWKNEQWELAGKAEPQPPRRSYMHPDSPALGSHWMKQSLSFLKMKLTNNTLDQHGHIILHSMHRYYPRFHVIQTDSPYLVRWAPFRSFSFLEMTFTAVTAYQNPKITKLKIDHNPFAKAFREGGTHAQGKRCRPSEKMSSADRKVVCKSSSGLRGTPSSTQSEETDKSQVAQTMKRGPHPSWSKEQDASESLHGEPLELHEYDYSCEEQMVPASVTYQHHRSDLRSVEYTRFGFPSSEADTPHALAPAQRDTRQQGSSHHHPSNTADWSQYPLFSYSSW
ncbi:T-box-containing protein TBX6L-like [Dunckerocampus dactyliophorus]|uniref:T-box-containing protein TBX6L-like n=1 Tax=Dunckerocampus dactyliophorus TaxID=161453 RepID=UPI0024063C93|nr:T-box-containing protein TBX6L-like [Dunckerocampus dactyliophorus]